MWRKMYLQPQHCSTLHSIRLNSTPVHPSPCSATQGSCVELEGIELKTGHSALLQPFDPLHCTTLFWTAVHQNAPWNTLWCSAMVASGHNRPGWDGWSGWWERQRWQIRNQGTEQPCSWFRHFSSRLLMQNQETKSGNRAALLLILTFSAGSLWQHLSSSAFFQAQYRAVILIFTFLFPTSEHLTTWKYFHELTLPDMVVRYLQILYCVNCYPTQIGQ